MLCVILNTGIINTIRGFRVGKDRETKDRKKQKARASRVLNFRKKQKNKTKKSIPHPKEEENALLHIKNHPKFQYHFHYSKEEKPVPSREETQGGSIIEMKTMHTQSTLPPETAKSKAGDYENIPQLQMILNTKSKKTERKISKDTLSFMGACALVLACMVYYPFLQKGTDPLQNNVAYLIDPTDRDISRTLTCTNEEEREMENCIAENIQTQNCVEEICVDKVIKNCKNHCLSTNAITEIKQDCKSYCSTNAEHVIIEHTPEQNNFGSAFTTQERDLNSQDQARDSNLAGLLKKETRKNRRPSPVPSLNKVSTYKATMKRDLSSIIRSEKHIRDMLRSRIVASASSSNISQKDKLFFNFFKSRYKLKWSGDKLETATLLKGRGNKVSPLDVDTLLLDYKNFFPRYQSVKKTERKSEVLYEFLSSTGRPTGSMLVRKNENQTITSLQVNWI